MRTAVARTVAVGLGGLLALTACSAGSSDESADEDTSFADSSAKSKVEAAKKAMSDLRSIHMTGTLSNDGQQAEVDLRLSDEGQCVGTYAFSGGVAEVRSNEEGAWMRPDAAIWKAFSGSTADQVTDFVGDKWVVLEAPQLEQMCDFESVMGSLLSGAEADREYSADGSEDIDGVKSFRIKSSGSSGTSYGYVQAEAPHYLTRTEREGEAPASMTFSDFDEVVEVDAPDADDIVDLDQYAS